MKSQHLRNEIINPTLDFLGMNSLVARCLLLGTAAQESWMGRYLVQINGPALSVFQVEPDSHTDLWDNYLVYRPSLIKKVEQLLIPGIPKEEQLKGNLYYATAVARLIYRRRPQPLPATPDPELLAEYWKKNYNTELGKGTVEEFVRNYKRFVK